MHLFGHVGSSVINVCLISEMSQVTDIVTDHCQLGVTFKDVAYFSYFTLEFKMWKVEIVWRLQFSLL